LEAIVARAKSGDHPVDVTNGAIEEALQESIASCWGVDEQTLADSDQTLADSDQTASDSDQSSADRDQSAADSDQAASDRDLACGVDARAHELSREVRQRTARERGQSAQARLDAARQRDAVAHARDLAALSRDLVADMRDLAMRQRDAASEQQEDGARSVTGAEIVIRAAGQRKRAARYRMQAAQQRELAGEDRQSAARDREQAARERLRALTDRAALAGQLAIVETDALTGARALVAGLTDLDHELDRCRETSGQLTVAYVDVVALDNLSDTHGAGASDALLKRVVVVISEQLRSFDLIIRLGNDEFLCAMSNMALTDIRQRFSQVAATLAHAPYAGAIRIGFAELTPDDSAAELIARADRELSDSRHGTHDWNSPDFAESRVLAAKAP
jgi:diguanylate cyclase (GGDEF)-like protein